LWDTGHQAYIHKLLTGRRYGFRDLKKAGGLSGYPNRAESEHDWIENSHASTVLSYAHGLASAFELGGEAVGHGGDRRVVAVIGDGALTGGMAYEALNNLGHSGRRVVVVLNDNGRSYAPTVSHLSQSLTSLRLHPTYIQTRQRLRTMLRELPAVGELAYSGVHGVTSALRELVAPTPSSRHWACATRDRSTDTTSPSSSRHCVTRPNGTDRSSSTSSPRRGGATRPPRRTRSSASTT